MRIEKKQTRMQTMQMIASSIITVCLSSSKIEGSHDCIVLLAIKVEFVEGSIGVSVLFSYVFVLFDTTGSVLLAY